MFTKRPSNSTLLPLWKLAWGKVCYLNKATWQEDKIAIFSQSTPDGVPSIAFSPSQRFVVTGEVWLSQTNQLMQLQECHQPISHLQLIAIAWEHWQVGTFEKLVGMFSLAVWDRQQQELWLGRDRTGSRTLYYTFEGATRWVGSSWRSLTEYHSQELDLVALRDYLCCAFVPGERTLWKQVRELRPGTQMHLPSGTTQAYWQLQEQIKEQDLSLSLAVWGDRLRSLLAQIIQEALPNNQPVGVFLSGGLDSSCITALATKIHSAPVHTYSIHFGQALPSELEFSSLVANYCQTQHHILEIPLTQMWKQLPETMAVLDDPIGDPLTVPNLLLGRLARQTVEIVLNGEGGDPCFGGPKNQPMLIHSLYQTLTQQDSISAYLQSFQKCYTDLPQLLKPEIWERVRSEPWVFADDLNSPVSYLNRLMVLNIKFKGADQILTKVNNLTQAAQLQGRSPLFDQRVVDFSMQVPPTYKLDGTTEKAILKQAMAGLLPDKIIHRPKSGMMVPVQVGFRDVWNRQARQLLLSRNAAIAPYFNSGLIRNWLNYQGDAWGRYGVKLWLLASLEYWLQTH